MMKLPTGVILGALTFAVVARAGELADPGFAHFDKKLAAELDDQLRAYNAAQKAGDVKTTQSLMATFLLRRITNNRISAKEPAEPTSASLSRDRRVCWSDALLASPDVVASINVMAHGVTVTAQINGVTQDVDREISQDILVLGGLKLGFFTR